MNSQSQQKSTDRQVSQARPVGAQRPSLLGAILDKLLRRKKKNDKTIYPLF
jgi:hypothetical protein